ncbi:hypothetical protein [uncultured Psychroserpens sp.]|uniref:hypothetical protein n=1 Tax=uncultured Psychroserpens sp. TaxID=255436 RepID=UPI002633459A|nr:hypothetical protein [uncultured Psychroserpens sp.]
MPKLTIHRVSSYENRARKIKVEIDGKVVDTIKDGEESTFEISLGVHTIQAKIDWCSSNVITYHAEDDSIIKLELRKGAGSALYRVTFGYKNYLSLVQVDIA